jgi:peptide/nickel transport system substrate-binding protein
MKQQFKKSAVLALAIALTAAGCSSSDKSSSDKPEASGTGAPSAESSVLRIKDKGVTAEGGTVYVLQGYDFDSLDPTNNYRTNSQDVGRLIYRTLTFIKDTAGEEPSIQPDLAERLGTPSDDGRTWTFKLRPGLKYEDGRPITAQDIKYSVMRSFESDVFSLGATWMPDLLANESGFEGPYATPEKDLTSVEAPDDRTLIFHFSGPQPDANWIMSMPYTSPVPKDSDTKQDYAKRPIASGPYQIETYVPNTSLTLVRNKNWDPATDPNRPAYPDRFQFELNVDKTAANHRLLAGTGNDAFAVPFDPTLESENYSKIEEPSVAPRFVNGPGPCVDYITMNTQKITDPDVRHAIALAIDRQAILDNYGGNLSGSIADSMIPPDLPGYVAPQLGLKPGGDPDAAKKLLEGKSVPPLHLLISDAGTQKDAKLIQANLKAIGLEVVFDPRPGDETFTIVDSDEAPELADIGGWCFDWPTAAAVALPVFGPNDDGTTWGSNNAAKYFDPKLSGELQELKSSTEDPATIAKKFVDIANEIQTTAWPLLPTVLNNLPEVVGAKVTNVGVSPVFGVIDLNTLAVQK